jgi:hypothetical protein
MLRLLISRNLQLETLQPKKKTLLNQAANSPLSKHRSSLKPISRNTEMGFQYTRLETFSHSTSLENLLNYEDGYVFAPAYTHSPTHLKVRLKKKQNKKEEAKKKTENEENKRKLARRGSREEAAAAFATAAVS